MAVYVRDSICRVVRAQGRVRFPELILQWSRDFVVYGRVKSSRGRPRRKPLSRRQALQQGDVVFLYLRWGHNVCDVGYGLSGLRDTSEIFQRQEQTTHLVPDESFFG